MFRNLFVLLVILLPFWAQAQTNSIEVTFENLIPAKGDLYVGIFNDSENFLDVEHMFLNQIADVEGESLAMVFNDVPPGNYCVTVYHDKNENGKMDFNFIGMPLETYGFSKNIFHRFWAPTFDECAFYLDDNKNLTINLRR